MYKFSSYYLDQPLVNGRVFDVFDPAPGVPVQDIAIFFVHGGGWISGSRTIFHSIMEAFGKLGYITASADYRLSGVTAFDQLSDIRQALDCFVDLLKKRNHPCRVAVHGSSAGAHLASLLVCSRPGELGEVNGELKYPEFRVEKASFHGTPYDFKPWEGMMPQFWNQMQGIAGRSYEQDPERYERLSLINLIREDNPEIFFIEAGNEHLFASELTLEIARKHRAMNISSQWKVYDRMEHGFFYELNRKMQQLAFDDLCAFLQGRLHTDL